MAGSRAFLIRFALVALTVPVVLGFFAYTFYNDIRTKSLYYRLDGSDLLPVLQDGKLIRTGDSLELWLPSLELVLSSTDFNQNPMAASYQSSTGGDAFKAAGFEDLDSLTQRWLKRIPELGLREMYSPAEDWLAFRIGKSDWLFYSETGTDLPDRIGGKKTRDFDGHWIAVELEAASFALH